MAEPIKLGKGPGAATAPAVNPAAVIADPTKSAGSIKVTGAPFKITNMAEKEHNIKLLVYGRPGSGKTQLLASCVDIPSMRDVLMIDAESGELTLEDNEFIQNANKVDHIKINDFATCIQIYQFLKSHIALWEKGDMETLMRQQALLFGVPLETVTLDNLRRYRTVIIDSLSEVDAFSMNQVLDMQPDKAMAGDMEVAGWPEFRKSLEKVKLLVRAFRDLPINVLIACGQTYSQDETKKFHYSPAMTGKLSVAVQGFVDVVGYLVVAPPRDGNPMPRMMFVQPVEGGARFDAKCRIASYKSPYFDNPTMTTIMDAIGRGV